ncbi:MAG: DUF4258 domain-containing protein [Pseudomonadota bacterium]
MADDSNENKVVRFRPRPDQLQARIRELAADSYNVLIPTDHSLERQDERDITDEMIYDTLRTGYIDNDIRPGENAGEWVCKMTKRIKHKREVGVVTVLIENQNILIVTVEWEDMR